jgi:hypothetical protein
VTWNCKHLAEGHRRKQIKVFNTSAGLYVPEIQIPIELSTEAQVFAHIGDLTFLFLSELFFITYASVLKIEQRR